MLKENRVEEYNVARKFVGAAEEGLTSEVRVVAVLPNDSCTS